MDIDTDDDVLQTLAEGKSMDYEQWPSLLTRLIPRLEKIVQDEFPKLLSSAQVSQPISSSPPQSMNVEASSSQTSTQSTNKENTAPTTLPPPLQNLLDSIISTLTTIFKKNPPHTIQRLAELLLKPKQHYRTLPSYLHALDRVVHVTSGANIFPLPPAIPDPSSLSILSNGTASVDPLSISWGNPASTPAASSLGSDESLGGALLTPISWLTKPGSRSPLEGEVRTESTEMIEGPNGPGGVETVTVSVNGISSATAAPSEDLAATLRAEGGITQGELLRQEQKAGVVPAAQLQGNKGDTDGLGEEDEIPHARGPEEIGMEDTGPQSSATGTTQSRGLNMGMQGIDVEAAVGRKLGTHGSKEEVDEETEIEKEEPSTPSTPKREADENLAGEAKRQRSSEPETQTQPKSEPTDTPTPMSMDQDSDTELIDTDGKTEEDVKIGEGDENKSSDAVDSTIV